MANKLEKQFFDTFGIEPFIYCSKPRLDCDARSKGFCRKDCEYYSGVLYPEITDHILLELICIIHTTPVIAFTSRNIEDLKEEVLLVLCVLVDHRDIKQQVQVLFKENN